MGWSEDEKHGSEWNGKYKNLQLIEHKFEANRFLSLQTVGVFCHFWYKLLDNKLPGRSLNLVVKKVLVDQVVASPIVIFLFFATLGVMRHESIDETLEEIKHKFLRLYKAEWTGKSLHKYKIFSRLFNVKF